VNHSSGVEIKQKRLAIGTYSIQDSIVLNRLSSSLQILQPKQKEAWKN
jgi:hypothetical protein